MLFLRLITATALLSPSSLSLFLYRSSNHVSKAQNHHHLRRRKVIRPPNARDAGGRRDSLTARRHRRPGKRHGPRPRRHRPFPPAATCGHRSPQVTRNDLPRDPKELVQNTVSSCTRSPGLLPYRPRTRPGQTSPANSASCVQKSPDETRSSRNRS